jgi:two-component system, chemotaxis family, protein-glutamate methylesterase/glutaminase
VRFEIVVVGTSLGGLKALETLLGGLETSFPLPIVIVQHRGTDSGEGMRQYLQRHTPLRIREPEDKEQVVPGRVYLAPADYHLLLEERSVSLSTEGPVRCARPSIDVLFESAADEYGKRTLGVIMTGAGIDGANGALRLKAAGGILVVQDPSTAECSTLPKSVMAVAGVDHVAALAELGSCLTRLVHEKSN